MLVVAGTAFIAATYGLVRLAYGLLLPDVQASLDLGSRSAGHVSSAASLAYCVGAVVGLVADRWPRPVLVAAVATGTAGATGMALAPSAAAFAVAAVVGSSSAGLASPGLVAAVERVVAERRRPRAQAVVNSGTGPGLVAAGVLALLLLPQWRAGFAVSAAVTLASGLVVVGALARGGGTSIVHRPAPGPGPSTGGRASVRGALLPGLGALALGTASASVWTYGRAYLAEEGLGATGSTLAWIGVGVGGTATVLSAGWLAARAPRAGWSVTVGSVGVALAVLGGVGDRPVAAVAACVLFGWGFVAATSALIAWAAQVRPDGAGGLTAAFFVLLVLGQAVGSTLAGEVAAVAGMPEAFLLSAGVALAGVVAGVVPGAGSASGRAAAGRAAAGRGTSEPSRRPLLPRGG